MCQIENQSSTSIFLTKVPLLGLTVLMDLHFLQSFGSNFELSSPVQLMMSYKYNDIFTKNVLIGEYPG